MAKHFKHEGPDPAAKDIARDDRCLNYVMVDAVAFADFFGPTLFSKEFQLRHYQLEPQLSQA